MADDNLRDFERASFTHDGTTRTLYRQGTGPAVIVIAEMPGITPKVAEFGRTVAGIGCTAVMPHLFGTPGRDPRPDAHGLRAAAVNAASAIVPACVSREFTVMATGRTSPVVGWLRALAAHEHERCGGPGVGAIGMCFTGGFALAMAADDRLLAPVLSQPSMPLPLTPRRRASIDISPEDLAAVKHRCAADGLTIMGLRFKGDRFVPRQRFDFLRRELGDAFVAIELDDEHANPDATLKPHSVVTEHLIDEPGQPTRAALDEVLSLFRRRLLSG
ncbi:dienelactone hydrolase family protein [Spirillospora sp. NPDC047279]|uniref:dienelactone hydrolase family protein n=1 Tax=Spirillospora sp. NPDC047279 TaxID=3155478 RepID=UPI0033F2E7BB